MGWLDGLQWCQVTALVPSADYGGARLKLKRLALCLPALTGCLLAHTLVRTMLHWRLWRPRLFGSRRKALALLDRHIGCSALPNVRDKLTAEACVAWPRKDNSHDGLERPSDACRGGSA